MVFAMSAPDQITELPRSQFISRNAPPSLTTGEVDGILDDLNGKVTGALRGLESTKHSISEYPGVGQW